MNAEQPVYLGVFAFFEEVPEPRVERTRDHPLMTVLGIALLTIICVGDGWEVSVSAKSEGVVSALFDGDGVPWGAQGDAFPDSRSRDSYKVVFLALQRKKSRVMAPKEWGAALSHFQLLFPDRFPAG